MKRATPGKYDRRQILTACLGLWALPAGGAAAAPGAPPREAGGGPDLPAGEWARRALAALERSGRRFVAAGRRGVAVCDLGVAGRLELAAVGDGAVRVSWTGEVGELEILRALEDRRVARVEMRLAAAAQRNGGGGFDVLRRVPAGYELTFSSPLALRHALPQRVAGEPPAVYGRLAETALRAARPLLG